MSIDTFSSAVLASAHTGEKSQDAIADWGLAFAVLGTPIASRQTMALHIHHKKQDNSYSSGVCYTTLVLLT